MEKLNSESLGFYTLEYLPPQPIPEKGHVWDVTLDYPGVKVTYHLPSDENGDLVEDICAPEMDCFGEELIPSWGYFKLFFLF